MQLWARLAIAATMAVTMGFLVLVEKTGEVVNLIFSRSVEVALKATATLGEVKMESVLRVAGSVISASAIGLLAGRSVELAATESAAIVIMTFFTVAVGRTVWETFNTLLVTLVTTGKAEVLHASRMAAVLCVEGKEADLLF